MAVVAALTVAAAVVGAAVPSHASGAPEPTWEDLGREATSVLQSLIRVPSVNPPGNELPAAELLADGLAAAGLAVTLVESAPGRGNVMARLRGDGSRRPILLLCHLDVVPVEDGWTVDPFAGEIRDGAIWGRGAIDAKGMCASNLVAFLALRRAAIPLARDVVFLAVADEEGAGTGAALMLERFPAELDVAYVLNEGGLGVRDAVTPGQVLFAIAAGEKGFADLRLVARGRPGHASFPFDGTATSRLVAALARLDSREPAPVFHEYMAPLLVRLGERERGLRGWLLRHPGLAQGFLLRRFAARPDTRATVTDTCAVTKLEAGVGSSTIPGQAEAWLDCRLLPGVAPAAWRERIQTEVAPFGVDVTLAGGWPGTTSPWDTELARALERHLTAGVPASVAAPIMSAPWTDSRFFRARGAVAYGIFPFVVSRDEAAGIHGNDERLPVAELALGVARTYRVLVEVAGGGAPRIDE